MGIASAQAPKTVSVAKADFLLHKKHAKELSLDCNTCHSTVSPTSMMMKRPGHTQCMACHQEQFEKELNPTICAQCHSSFPPTSAADLYPFPRYKKQRAILFEFAHAKHVDSHGRINPKTGFRADCTFCHKFDQEGTFATFPGHAECSACHAKEGMHPRLTQEMKTEDCRGCHAPEEIENPGFTKERRLIAAHVVSGVYVNLKFSHVAHFRNREKFNINCTTCHYAVPESTSLANLTLPKMVDCVGCHDVSKAMPVAFRMSNCGTCHVEKPSAALPPDHTRNVKPAFHTESFRRNHEAEAKAKGAKCFICHTNVVASASAADQCTNCHQVMRPVSHTARWKDDVHGKMAALDRTTCATCHVADECSRCHNLLPASHQPLAIFKAGAHANPALLDQRSCMTCHTFQNTCAECHVRK